MSQHYNIEPGCSSKMQMSQNKLKQQQQSNRFPTGALNKTNWLCGLVSGRASSSNTPTLKSIDIGFLAWFSPVAINIIANDSELAIGKVGKSRLISLPSNGSLV